MKGREKGSKGISDEAQAREAMDAAHAWLGAVDILVNNAGALWPPGQPRAPFAELAADLWHWVQRVNVDSAFYCIRAALPGMLARGRGRIINLSSLAVHTGGTGRNAPYTTSKSALVGLTKTLALELGPHGITVNAVAPGIIQTAMFDQSVPADERAALLARIPLRRFGTVGDVAGVVAFLASEAAGYLTPGGEPHRAQRHHP